MTVSRTIPRDRHLATETNLPENPCFAADDLPLNVSRETLQQSKFLKQIKQIIVRRLIQLLTRISEEDPDKFAKVQEVYGPIIKLGAVESMENREKLTKLARFSTTQRNGTSLDQVG